MLPNRLTHLLLLVPLAAFMLSGCSKPPRAELAAARHAVAEAYAAGAAELAGNEYQAAQAALRNAERLTDQGEYKAARDILSTAEAQAHIAVTRARQERSRIEQERLHRKQLAEQRRRQALAAEKKKPQEIVKPRPRPKPVQPKPVRIYQVKSGETLWEIAARPEVYGDELLWPLLYKANRDQITDPRKIYAGQKLTVPRDFTSKAAAGARQEARDSGIFPLPKAQ